LVSHTIRILTSLRVGKDVTIHMGGFVFQNAGKLRDYYRIGKMLGSGMSPTLDEIV